MIVNGGYLNVGSSPSFSSAQLGNGSANLTVASGASTGGYGTMSFNNATFNTGSKFVIGLDPQAPTSGLVNAGTLNINAGVDLQLESVTPLSANQSYVIADYNALNGTFDTITPVGLTEMTTIDYGSPSNTKITVNTRTTTTLVDVTAAPPVADVVLDLQRSQRPISDEMSFSPRAPLVASQLNTTGFGNAYGKDKLGNTVLKSLANRGPMIADKNERRIWAMPYYTHNKVANLNAKASKSNNEGIIFGYEVKDEHRRHKEYIGALAIIGMGKNHSPSTIAQNNKIDSKVLGLGAYYKRETDKIELNAIANGALNHHRSKRYGNPLPGIMYTATSKYYSKNIAADVVGLLKYSNPILLS